MGTMAMQIEVEPLEAGATRDKRLVRFVGRHGVVSYCHVMREFGIGRTAAYRLVKACKDRGLLGRDTTLRNEQPVLYATREGLRWAGLGYRVATLSPSLIHHDLRCTSMAQALGQEFPAGIYTERDIRWRERIEGRPFASAKTGERPDGGPRLHLPDLAAVSERGIVAIEVELSAKAPRRLEAIVRAWRRASWVSEVRYYCAPGQTRRAVERAIRATRSEDRVFAREMAVR